MAFGRMIRVGSRWDPDVRGLYVVAESDAGVALRLVRTTLGHQVEVEDLGRVAATVLHDLGLAPGQMAKA